MPPKKKTDDGSSPTVKKPRVQRKKFVPPDGWSETPGYGTKTVHTAKCDYCGNHVTDGNPIKQHGCGINICWLCEQRHGGLAHGRDGQCAIAHSPSALSLPSSAPRLSEADPASEDTPSVSQAQVPSPTELLPVSRQRQFVPIAAQPAYRHIGESSAVATSFQATSLQANSLQATSLHATALPTEPRLHQQIRSARQPYHSAQPNVVQPVVVQPNVHLYHPAQPIVVQPNIPPIQEPAASSSREGRRRKRGRQSPNGSKDGSPPGKRPRVSAQKAASYSSRVDDAASIGSESFLSDAEACGSHSSRSWKRQNTSNEILQGTPDFQLGHIEEIESPKDEVGTEISVENRSGEKIQFNSNGRGEGQRRSTAARPQRAENKRKSRAAGYRDPAGPRDLSYGMPSTSTYFGLEDAASALMNLRQPVGDDIILERVASQLAPLRDGLWSMFQVLGGCIRRISDEHRGSWTKLGQEQQRLYTDVATNLVPLVGSCTETDLAEAVIKRVERIRSNPYAHPTLRQSSRAARAVTDDGDTVLDQEDATSTKSFRLDRRGERRESRRSSGENGRAAGKPHDRKKPPPLQLDEDISDNEGPSIDPKPAASKE